MSIFKPKIEKEYNVLSLGAGVKSLKKGSTDSISTPNVKGCVAYEEIH